MFLQFLKFESCSQAYLTQTFVLKNLRIILSKQFKNDIHLQNGFFNRLTNGNAFTGSRLGCRKLRLSQNLNHFGLRDFEKI